MEYLERLDNYLMYALACVDENFTEKEAAVFLKKIDLKQLRRDILILSVIKDS